MVCISEPECCLANIIIIFLGFSSFVVILAWYRALLVRHFLLSGHWCLLIQLHVLAILSFGGLIIFLLYVLIMFFMLGKQL